MGFQCVPCYKTSVVIYLVKLLQTNSNSQEISVVALVEGVGSLQQSDFTAIFHIHPDGIVPVRTSDISFLFWMNSPKKPGWYKRHKKYSSLAIVYIL